MSLFARLVTIGMLMALPACSNSGPGQQDSAEPAARKLSSGPSLQQQLVLYQQMVDADSPALAVPLGEDILKLHPDSEEAAVVRQSLEPLRAKAAKDSENKRLARLWSYQGGSESGGQQQTASIYSRQGAGGKGDPVRLVLRRHSAWGQSVYLYDNGAGFRCASPCRISAHLDDRPVQRFAASLPETGEPALFIEDDKPFLLALKKTHKLRIEVTMKDGTARELVFEVGGFDDAKWLPVSAG